MELAGARNNRSSRQGVRGQARRWWHVSSSVVCRGKEVDGREGKTPTRSAGLSAGVCMFACVVWCARLVVAGGRRSTPRRNFTAPKHLLARPVIGPEQGSAQEGSRAQGQEGQTLHGRGRKGWMG